MQCSACALSAEDCQGLSGTDDDHRYLVNGKDPATIQIITSLISLLSALRHQGAANNTQHRVIYFLVQVVPHCIHLISAHQKNFLITGVIRHEKKAFTAHCEPTDGPEISRGCSYNDKELPDHRKALIPIHVRITKQDSGP